VVGGSLKKELSLLDMVLSPWGWFHPEQAHP